MNTISTDVIVGSIVPFLHYLEQRALMLTSKRLLPKKGDKMNNASFRKWVSTLKFADCNECTFETKCDNCIFCERNDEYRSFFRPRHGEWVTGLLPLARYFRLPSKAIGYFALQVKEIKEGYKEIMECNNPMPSFIIDADIANITAMLEMGYVSTSYEFYMVCQLLSEGRVEYGQIFDIMCKFDYDSDTSRQYFSVSY